MRHLLQLDAYFERARNSNVYIHRAVKAGIIDSPGLAPSFAAQMLVIISSEFRYSDAKISQYRQHISVPANAYEFSLLS